MWAAAAERARQVSVIKISGATGPNATRINGMFELMAAKEVGGVEFKDRMECTFDNNSVMYFNEDAKGDEVVFIAGQTTEKVGGRRTGCACA